MACGIGKVNMKEISKSVVPILIGAIIALFIITYIPQISLFLPSLMKK